ncbi:AzlD domain-containing protein [Nocardia higoensis]|uniref:AzlD domain-containing protein n=1 Tax=Nocardia higoensis TaxID=228599 RepID=A0ABS0DJJ9_9NOCA|nr:AzlD domain-containing protein [Nocardia higoensis]MBF6357767.1 AzlD domain-containing protein [Nocardia higoensis]
MMLGAGVVALAVGTYAFRWAGPALRSRVRLPDHARRLLETGAVVLLAALAAVTMLPLGTGEIGIAMPVGVGVAGLFAWRRSPLLVIVLAAAATTTLLRLLGLP